MKETTKYTKHTKGERPDQWGRGKPFFVWFVYFVVSCRRV